MAKVSIKSEKITPSGGIFHVRELFSRKVMTLYLQKNTKRQTKASASQFSEWPSQLSEWPSQLSEWPSQLSEWATQFREWPSHFCGWQVGVG